MNTDDYIGIGGTRDAVHQPNPALEPPLKDTCVTSGIMPNIWRYHFNSPTRAPQTVIGNINIGIVERGEKISSLEEFLLAFYKASLPGSEAFLIIYDALVEAEVIEGESSS
jgi:hypothetical protein